MIAIINHDIHLSKKKKLSTTTFRLIITSNLISWTTFNPKFIKPRQKYNINASHGTSTTTARIIITSWIYKVQFESYWWSWCKNSIHTSPFSQKQKRYNEINYELKQLLSTKRLTPFFVCSFNIIFLSTTTIQLKFEKCLNSKIHRLIWEV